MACSRLLWKTAVCGAPIGVCSAPIGVCGALDALVCSWRTSTMYASLLAWMPSSRPACAHDTCQLWCLRSLFSHVCSLKEAQACLFFFLATQACVHFDVLLDEAAAKVPFCFCCSMQERARLCRFFPKMLDKLSLAVLQTLAHPCLNDFGLSAKAMRRLNRICTFLNRLWMKQPCTKSPPFGLASFVHALSNTRAADSIIAFPHHCLLREMNLSPRPQLRMAID